VLWESSSSPSPFGGKSAGAGLGARPVEEDRESELVNAIEGWLSLLYNDMGERSREVFLLNTNDHEYPPWYALYAAPSHWVCRNSG
jgi:hypothetical protein